MVRELQAGQIELEGQNAELLRPQDVLRKSEERYRCIVQTAEEGVLTIYAASLADFVNPKMAQMLGHTVQEMIGRPLADFMDDKGRIYSVPGTR